MVITYMIVICLSALLGAWVSMRGLRRLAPITGIAPRAGWCAAFPALGFLMVVSAPPPMLVAALLLGGLVSLMPNRMAGMLSQCILMLAAVLIGLSGLPVVKAEYLSTISLPAAYAAAGVAWIMAIVAAGLHADRAGQFSIGSMVMLAAVAVAPILISGLSSIAFDAAIIASALAGVLLAGGAVLPMGQGARLALGVMMGYLPISAAWHGAWMAGAASLAIWLGAAAWAWAANDPLEKRYA